VAGFELAVGEAQVGAETLLISEIGFDGIGHEEVGAAAGLPGELSQAFLGGRFEAHAEGGAFCVGHEHTVWHGARNEGSGKRVTQCYGV